MFIEYLFNDFLVIPSDRPEFLNQAELLFALSAVVGICMDGNWTEQFSACYVWR